MKTQKKLTKKRIKQLAKRELKKKDLEWSRLVRERDKECVICHSTNRLNAHHIICRQNKELRWDLNNGISLCPKCHRFSFVMSAHQNSFVFILWLMDNRIEQFEYLKEKIKEEYNLKK